MPDSVKAPGNSEKETTSEGGPVDVVYTALFAGRESLIEAEVALNSRTDFICFTNDPSLTSSTWRVELVEPLFPMDPIRSARWIKTYGEESIWRDYDRSLWVDNTVVLKTDPRTVLDSLLEAPQSDLALFEHSLRDRLIDEFSAVVEAGADDPARVNEQLIHYAETLPEVLDERALWTGLMARRHSKRMMVAMSTWAAHVCRYSRRDQLSVNTALHGTGLNVRRLTIDNRDSEWHTVPLESDALNRQDSTRLRAFEQSVRAPLARLRAIEGEHNDLLEAHAISAARRDSLIEAERTHAREFEALYIHEEGRKRELEALYADEGRRLAEASAALARSKARVAKLNERVERLRRRVVTLNKRVEQLRRRVVVLDRRAAPQPDVTSRPLRAHARRVMSAGKRVAATARARSHG
ncbi:DUF616 domain-containing protein [Nocardioides glacieisoli]|uniref:DUF616 domain-containing protein n=1 Tax=Nocardioides glacieisoli TaxID=1168730 RepID=A0A4Q2S6W7_9ACTN|nr:glycosyltransferase domain-containing protein [Nocardioides glacieisoli]RYB96103.1 DUF616 domain-containing protein [Nocardioides glacieisoli]